MAAEFRFCRGQGSRARSLLPRCQSAAEAEFCRHGLAVGCSDQRILVIIEAGTRVLRSLIVLACLSFPAFAEPRTDLHGDPLPDGAIFRYGTVRHRIGTYRSVRSWDLAPDGKTLAVEDHRGITLWDVETGKPTTTFPTARGQDKLPEFVLHYSADGKSIARLAAGVVSVLDATTGKERFSHDFTKRGARQMSFVTGPDRIVVTVDEGALFLDPETGRTVTTLKPEDAIWNLSPSGHYFMGWSQGNGVTMVPHLVDAKTGKVRARFPDAKGPVANFGILSSDDRRLYFPRTNGRVQTFDAETGKRLEDLRPPGASGAWYGNWFSLSPDGNTAYLAQAGHPVLRRDLKAGKWLDPLPRSFGGQIVHLSDGKRILQVGDDGVLRRYDLATLKQLPQTQGFERRLYAYSSPDGKRIGLSSEDATAPRVDVFDPAGRLLSTIRPGAHTGAVWSRDGRRFLCDRENRITLLDEATGAVERVLRPNADNDQISDVYFSPGGERLVVVINNGHSVATYDVATGKRAALAHTKARARTDLSPDGGTLVFDSDTQGLALFDVAAGRFRTGWIDAPPQGAHYWTERSAFSPDGSYLLSWDGAIGRGPVLPWVIAVVRDPETLEKQRRFETGLTDDYSFAISPDGQWLAIGDHRGDLHLWDVAAGKKIGTWAGHRDGITKVVFLGPGRVLTSSNDLTALLWELRPKEKPKAALWDALSGNDAVEAYRAVWALAAEAKGPEVLRGKIAPAKPLTPDQVRQWIADLGADRFATREAATKALTEFGRLAEPVLRAARAKTGSEEVRVRLDAILAKVVRVRTPAEVVQARAVAALELAGTEAARKLLSEWAAGADGARLTIDAKAALTR
jgi:WD40 repeat protein